MVNALIYLLLALHLTSGKFPLPRSSFLVPHVTSPNLLLNGDFRRQFQHAPADWGAHEGISSRNLEPRHPHCLQTSIAFPQDAYASQYLPLDGRRISQARFSVRAAWKNVRRGREDTNACRAALIFYDAHGGSMGDPADLGLWTGTRNWRAYTRLIDVPADARRFQVTLGLNGCAGTAWFADARLEVTRGDLTYRTPADSRTDTRGWFAWGGRTGRRGEEETGRQGDRETPASGSGKAFSSSVSDVHSLLDAPAGKHGFTMSRPDGHLYFADGARARFWGVDMMADACFPERAAAGRIADRLARNGVNIVRLHHIDAPWSKPNVFDPRRDDTLNLNPDALDKLDYFVACLRRAGIYIYLDLLTNRHFKAGDRVRNGTAIEDGLKIVAHFDTRIKTLHKRYMRQLLTHINPYTRLRWLDDPALALMEVINEDSLLYENWYYRVPPAYLRDLRSLCRRIDARADPAREPFDVPTRRALYQIENGYYDEMRAYLRKLGVRCATTGSNHWEDLGAALRADSHTDYIDRHFYWDHPEGGFGYFQRFDNTPMLTNPIDNGLIPLLSQMRVAGKPFVVTEWCFCWPNDYIAEGPMIGTLAACQQDWDVMIWFDYTGEDWEKTIDNEFDVGNKPHVFAQWPACALAFYRRDIAPLPSVLTADVADTDLFAGRLLGDGFPLDAAFTHRLQSRMGAVRSRTGLAPPFPPLSAVWQTPQSAWDAHAGILTIDTPRTAACVGFAGGRQFVLGSVTLAPISDFSALIVSSLDEQNIDVSRHLLLTATSHAENTGMVMTPGRTSVTNPGRAPILVQPVQGSVVLKQSVSAAGEAEGKAWKAYALDAQGRRGQELPLEATEAGTRLRLGAAPCLWVEFVR